MSSPHYKAFISYSHADSRWAEWIHRELERYRVPAKLIEKHGLTSNRLHPIFRDRDELSSSSSLSSAIQSALEASDNLIVVCSPAAAESRWVNEEIKTFQSLGRATRVFCLIVDGDDDQYFPPALQNDEPLGTDLRPYADGKNDAKLKLIAGMLDIPFGTLKDREQRRRARFFGGLAAAAVVLAGVMTALAINAVLASREAEKSRLVATEALADSEAVAAFLATMLTEIDPEAMGDTIVADLTGTDESSKLAPGFNATDTARKLLDEHVLAKATTAVDEQFVDRPAIGARLEASLGASYHAIGLYGNAIDRFQAALDLNSAQYGSADPRTISAQSGLGASLLYEGRLDESVTVFEASYQTALDELGRSHDETLAAMSGLAMTYTDLDRFDEARTLLETASALMIETKGREHTNTVDVLNNYGWTLYKLGEFELAEKVTSEQLEIQRRVFGPDAYRTLSTLNNLALIYGATGRLAEAEDAHREEWEISQRVLGANHPEVLISMLNLGRVLSKSMKLDEAALMLDDAHVRAEAALPPVHPLLAAIVTACGEVALSQGDRAKALELFLKTEQIYLQMFEPGHPRFDRLKELLAEARA